LRTESRVRHPAAKIFINYRRGDDAGFTQALYRRLEIEFASGGGKLPRGHQRSSRRRPGRDRAALGRIADRTSGDPDDLVVIEIKAALD
jgi:hypothetical protein